MAAHHGVTEAGISAYPQVVARQMVVNFLGESRGDHCALLSSWYRCGRRGPGIHSTRPRYARDYRGFAAVGLQATNLRRSQEFIEAKARYAGSNASD